MLNLMRILWEAEAILVQQHGKTMNLPDVRRPMMMNHEPIVKKIRAALASQDMVKQWWKVNERSPVREMVYCVVNKKGEMKLDAYHDNRWLSNEVAVQSRTLTDELSTGLMRLDDGTLNKTADWDETLYWIEPPDDSEWPGNVHGSWGWRYSVTETPTINTRVSCIRSGSTAIQRDNYYPRENRWANYEGNFEQWWKPTEKYPEPTCPPLPPL